MVSFGGPSRADGGAARICVKALVLLRFVQQVAQVNDTAMINSAGVWSATVDALVDHHSG